MAKSLLDVVAGLGNPRVLVVGDLMLDRYVWGNAERISQEAPVILLRADKKEERLGGASSVATMLQALEANVSIIGLVGEDRDGESVIQILKNLRVNSEGIIRDATRPTTVKERYVGRAQQKHPQQILRVDYEVRDPANIEIENALCDAISKASLSTDVILISDYDKGVCTEKVIQHAVSVAKKVGVRVIADPIRGNDYSRYRGCSAITPNRLEASLASGINIQNNTHALEAARKLQSELQLEAAIITLDKDGMALIHRNGFEGVYPTRARAVYDITGAGDMVMSVLGLAIAAKYDYPDAIRLANIAGGLEVEKLGVATVTREEMSADILHTLHETDPTNPQAKILSDPQLVSLTDRYRTFGKKVVFTNGCFDILHAGHVQYLNEAKKQGDILVLGLNSDESIRRLKGEGRPVNSQDARAAVIAGLQSVDHIVIFTDDTPKRLIELVKPDVLVKGSDYKKETVVGADFVESYGGRVHLAELLPGFSTTRVVQQLKES